ncbi:MAG: SipW-dependent-type signal peptide-containing protein [Firmicutes bacterium]|nr:SipW-dependent-type signal peptide-containing protein [Bacillota bacterium]
MKKKVLSIVAVVLVLCCAIGGTLAWLTDKTASVKNTFTVGDINIELTETTTNYKMVPGNTISKDPKVTVKANSEACWLFVKVEKSANFDSFMTYDMADGWTELPSVTGVYYREVAATTAATDFSVLKGDSVSVKDTVTKADLNALTQNTFPTLTFTAYAVQKDNVADAATAWSKL